MGDAGLRDVARDVSQDERTCYIVDAATENADDVTDALRREGKRPLVLHATDAAAVQRCLDATRPL